MVEESAAQHVELVELGQEHEQHEDVRGGEETEGHAGVAPVRVGLKEAEEDPDDPDGNGEAGGEADEQAIDVSYRVTCRQDNNVSNATPLAD